MDGLVNALAVGHGVCGVILSLSSLLGDPDLALVVLDLLCSFGAVLWLNHIDKYGGSENAVYMFRFVALSSALGASAVLVRRRHFVWPADEEETTEETTTSELEKKKLTGYELLGAVLDDGGEKLAPSRDSLVRRSR